LSENRGAFGDFRFATVHNSQALISNRQGGVMPLLPNQILNNRYQILALLGQGGMGAVYRAFDQVLQRPVAIKEHIPDPNATPQGLAQARAQFQREAQVLANLHHDNLPRVTDYFSFGGNEYLVMDLIEGMGLDQVVQQHGAISEGAVRAWMNQVLDALIYIHSQNPPVIHRDIKPANLILKPDGKVTLVDFGLVKLLDPNNPRTLSAMRAMGTPEYAPIEQFSPGMHTDARSDIYSLGATMYHLLSGRPPLDVPRRLVDPTQMPNLRAINPNVSPQMEGVVHKALEIQPQNRFQSAAEMKQALATTVSASGAQTSTHYVPPPPPPPRQTSAPLFPVLVGIAGAVVVLLCVVLAIAVMARQPNSVALAPTSTTAVPTATPLVIVVTATPIPTPTATATAQVPVISPENAAQIRELATLSGHTGSVRSVAFAPDGRTLASGSSDRTIKLWDVASGREVRTLSGHTDDVWSVAFAPDGRTLASGADDNTIKLWDVASGREVRTLSGHTASVLSVAFAPDGRTLASGSVDKTIKLWDVTGGREVRTLSGHSAWVSCIAFAPDGLTLASGSWQEIKFWDVASGREVRTLSGYTNEVHIVAFAPDGRTLASGLWDRTIRLWDVTSGREVRTLRGHTASVFSVAFAPDGRTLASGSSDNTIKLWDVASGREVRTLRGHTADVRSVAFSPDGRTLASGSDDGTVRLWGIR
jgi:serine/threonine protein kinase